MGSSDRAAPAFIRLAGHPLRWQLLTGLAHGDLRVRELVARVGQPQSLVSYHLRLLRDGGLVTTTRSTFDGRDTYYHLDLDRCAHALADAGAALHPALDQKRPAPATRRMRHRSVLFVCTGNSARSPIAEALLRHHTDGGVTTASAGTHPGPAMHQGAVDALRRHHGIDLAARRPRHVDTLAGHRFDYVVTLCDRAREALPDLGGRRLHWSIPEPGAGEPAAARAAAEIDTRVRHLLPVLATTEPTAGPTTEPTTEPTAGPATRPSPEPTTDPPPSRPPSRPPRRSAP